MRRGHLPTTTHRHVVLFPHFFQYELRLDAPAPFLRSIFIPLPGPCPFVSDPSSMKTLA
jgi:hypothetical protein